MGIKELLCHWENLMYSPRISEGNIEVFLGGDLNVISRDALSTTGTVVSEKGR